MGGIYGPTPGEVGWSNLLGAIPASAEARRDRKFKEQQQQIQLEILRQQQQRILEDAKLREAQAKREGLRSALEVWGKTAGAPWTPEIEEALGPLGGAAKQTVQHPLSGTPIPSPMTGLPMGQMPDAELSRVRIPYDQVAQRQLMVEQMRGQNRLELQAMRNNAYSKLNDVKMKIAEMANAVQNRRLDIANEAVKVQWARLTQEQRRLEAEIAHWDAQLENAYQNSVTNRMRAEYAGSDNNDDAALMALIQGLSTGQPAQMPAPSGPQMRDLPDVPPRTPLPGSPASRSRPGIGLSEEQKRKIREAILKQGRP